MWRMKRPDGVTCVNFPRCNPISIMNFLFTICVKCAEGMWLCVYVLGEAMCTYPPHCFYCYQTGHLFWGTDCALCTFEGCCSYSVWLHFLPPFSLPRAPVSPLRLVCSVVLFSFCGGGGGWWWGEGVVECLVLCEQRRRPPNTITGCFGPLHFTRSEGADLSQLRAGRAGCCPSHCDPAPLIALISCTLRKTRARVPYPLCAAQWTAGLGQLLQSGFKISG